MYCVQIREKFNNAEFPKKKKKKKKSEQKFVTQSNKQPKPSNVSSAWKYLP